MATTTVVWGPDHRRRARLEAELRRIVAALPGLRVKKAILFGSLVSGRVGPASDLDLILVADSDERFTRRLERFYQALSPSIALDLFVYTPEELAEMSESNSFIRAAVAHGTVVYEA